MLQLGRRGVGAVQPIEGALVLEAGANISDIAHERLVEDLALRGLHAHGPHENEPAKSLGSHGRHLRRDPAAEAQADEGNAAELEGSEEGVVHHRDVADGAQPRRPLSSVVARMRGKVDGEPPGQGIVKRQAIEAPHVVVQEEERIARPPFP